MEASILYTVGHSTHPMGYFIELLQEHAINCLIDVRSVAASRYNPQYNKRALSDELYKQGIAYMHFAEEFGARHTRTDLLDNEGKVDFEKVRGSKGFKIGIEKLRLELNKGFTIALMCAESDPFDCHRFSMISPGLEMYGFAVKHILKDKRLKSNAELEGELLKKYDKKIPKPTMFEPGLTREDRLAAAYRLRNKDIGFVPS